MRLFLPALLAACAAGLCALPAAAEEEVFEQAVAQPNVLFTQPDVVYSAVAPVSEYWLGIGLSPADATLLSQLVVKQGVVVAHVAPDSPASKAGLAQHDLLVRFAGKEVASPEALIALVEEQKEKEAEVEFFRGGKQQTLKITPIKRPAGVAERIPLPHDFRANLPEGARRWVEQLREAGVPGAGGDGPIRFQFAHPGVVLGSRAVKANPMPKDLKITITKQGDEPLKIVVEQGDKKWEASEKELDKLPAEVRGHVQRMLPQDHMAIFQTRVAPPAVAVPNPYTPGVPVPTPGVGPARIMVRTLQGEEIEKKFEKRLEDLQKRVEELEKRVK